MVKELEVEPLDLEEIITNLEELEEDCKTNTTEPLAAHSILPLLKELADYIYDKEVDEDIESGGDVAVKTESGGSFISKPMLDEVAAVLEVAAFANLYDASLQIPPEHTEKARMLLFAFQSEAMGIEIEDVAEFYKQQLSGGTPPSVIEGEDHQNIEAEVVAVSPKLIDEVVDVEDEEIAPTGDAA